MAPKHPYLEQEIKGAFLSKLDDGEELLPAARKLKMNDKTARSIKERSDQRITYYANYELPPPSLHDRACRAPKSGRRPTLSEVDINTLDQGIRVDRHHRDILQFKVAQELHLPGSQTTIRRAAKRAGINRCAPIKKLALIEV